MSNVREVATRSANIYEELSSFEADQEITAGGLRVKGRVKFRKPRSVVVDYEEYQNPLEDFELEVSGGPEYVGDDLVDSRLVFRGSDTWIHLVDRSTAIREKGRQLHSPFAGVDIIGQLSFLPSLVSDFLLKDGGEGEINDRPVDRLGLKPKASRRSLFLKDEVFNLTRAELAIDRELGLPLKITYYPGEGDQFRFSSSRGGPVYVEYSNYRIDELQERDFRFDPSKVEKVFREQRVSEEEFEESFPAPVPFSRIEDKGYERAGNKISIFEADENGRAYSSLVFVKPEEESGRPTASVQLLVGNYLSREMSRHRAFLSDHGEEVDLGERSARLVDRGGRVKDQLPEEWDQEIHEIGWRVDQFFYYLLGQGIGEEELLEIAREFGQ